MTPKSNPNEIYLTRLYDAPVKSVWEAWTDPAQASKWWGPRGYTITNHNMDIKTGGSWSYTMHGPDGVDYENKTKYLEVEKYTRLVYDHGGSDDRPAMFRVTVSFSEIAGKTLMEMCMALPTAEAAIETKKIIKKGNGNSTWDRLAEYLSPTEIFVINRTFDAPRDLMFTLWTDAQHFSKWLPPTGFTMEFIRAEIKPGGLSFYSMPGPGGMKMYGKVNYQEIHKPDRLVYTQVFCDENEKITRHPMSPTWPEVMLTKVSLAEEGPTKTRVTVTWKPYGEATAIELETFKNAKAGMTQGWTGSFDKLEEYIKTQSL